MCLKWLCVPGSDVKRGLQVNALSPDGRCKAFGAEADGYGRGEGVATAVLQSLGEQVEGTGRGMLALLTGSAVNQDGRSSSLTVRLSENMAGLLDTQPPS